MMSNHKEKACTESCYNKGESTMAVKRVLSCLFSILLFFSFLAGPAWSWTADTSQNTPISTALDNQEHPTMVSDGSGGAIITWTDERGGGRNIYAQRIDSLGSRLWENGAESGDYKGIPISTGTGDQRFPKITSDGSGGAIIVWEDQRSGGRDIYAQRVNSTGNRLWENSVGSGDYDGILISAALNDQLYLKTVSDGSGGAIIAWWDRREDYPNYDIYAQRVDSTGNRLWENGIDSGDYDGIPISIATNNQVVPHIVSDGFGGAIIIWRDYRSVSPTNQIYAQRVDSGGNRLWENGIGSGDYDGILMSTDYVYDPTIVSDGSGGAVITWAAQRGGPFDIYAQRVDSTGNRLWENGIGSGDYNGIPISTAIGGQQFPKITRDGAGGAIITWTDERGGGRDIYAQRIDLNGNRLWENGIGSGDYDGIPISITTGNQFNPNIVSDGFGGAIITWTDERGGGRDIYAQRIDSNGNRLWENGIGGGDYNGIPISTATGRQADSSIVSDGFGGAIITWTDERSGPADIYGQRIYSNGNLCTVITPSNLSPADMSTTGLTPMLTSTPFEDTAGQVSHAASQWEIGERSDFAPDTIQAAVSDDNEYIEYTLPFTFPFFLKNITSISVNTNGLIALLEDGESCYECDYEGTHAEGDYVNEIDAIFASNDDLETEDGYLNIYDQDSYVMIEWFGSTAYDYDSITNPIHFQVEIHSDGTIKWNFGQMDFTGYDYDMYSGIYPNGRADINVGYVINTQSSWSFDPTTQTVSPVSFKWDVPNPYFLYDSGETSSDLTSFNVPAAAGLSGCTNYFWRVRYKTSIGDWTPWSSPTSFVASAGDSDGDGDVDGLDLSVFANVFDENNLPAFANEFGRIGCPN